MPEASRKLHGLLFVQDALTFGKIMPGEKATSVQLPSLLCTSLDFIAVTNT